MARIPKTKKVKVTPSKRLSIKLGGKDDLAYLQKQLKTDKNWYQLMVENMQNSVWVADRNVKILYVNPALCKLLGYSFDEIIGKSEYNFWDKNSISKVEKVVAIDRKKGISSSYEGKLIVKSGEKIPVLCLGTPLPDGGTVGILTDLRKLKEAEVLTSKLRKATEQSIDGIAVADFNGNIEFVNTAWAKMHGYKLKELTGKHLSLFHTKEQMKKDVIPFNRYVMKTGGHQGEIGHVKKDGTVFPTFMTTTLLRNEKGAPISFVGTARDITRQKEAEKLLEQRVKEFNVLYRAHAHLKMAHPLSRVLTNIAHDIVHAFQFMGVAQAKIVFDGKICKTSNKQFDFVHKIEEPIIVADIKRGVIQVGYIKKLPQIKKIPFLPEEHKLVESIARVLARHIFSRETIERHRKIVRKSFTSIFITVNGVLRYLNPRFCKMFKMEEQMAIGKSISDFILSPHIDLKNDSVLGSCHYESKGKQTDGNIIDLDIVMQNIDYHGEKAVLWHAHDVTILKRAEAKLKNFNAELKQLVEEKTRHLELANKRLRSLNELKDEFIAVTSHELRSPLTSIRGYLSFLVEKESLECVPDSIKQYLFRAYHNAESLNYLVNNILDVSRLDTGRFELQTVKTDLIQLAKNVIDSLSFQANEKNLEIKLKNPLYLDKLILEVDPIRLSQVLRNLLDNAIKYTCRDKKITVEVTTDWGFAVIKVTDQGIGIPKKQMESIFDKFIQLKNVDTRYKGGAGLGLFIARRIIQLHGGIIKVDSEKTKGTTFTIQLPLVSS